MLSATSTTNNVSSPYKDMLHTVTNMKLDEIKIQQKRMLAHYKEVKEESNAATKLTQKLRILYEGMQSFAIAGSLVHKDLENIESLIKQSETDPTISKDLLRHWINYLTTEITRCEKRWEYAHLFGGLLTEYLDNEQPASSDTRSWTDVDSLGDFKDDLDAPGNSSTPESKRIAKTEYEQRSFVVQQVDVEAAKVFLETKQIGWFGTSFITKKVSSKDVVAAITSLLNNDLLNDEKKEILEDLQSNETILNEFAAIMTMMMAKVKDGQWTWPHASSSLVWGDVRPAVGGRHRIFLDYDLSTTIFLEFVGLRWSQTFKRVMADLVAGSVGKTSIWNVGQISTFPNASVEKQRATIFRTDFFLNILPETDADARRSRGSYDERVCGEDGAAGLMHKLLLLIATEAKFHQAIHKETPFTVVKTDLASFGLSLNHDLVLMKSGSTSIYHPDALEAAAAAATIKSSSRKTSNSWSEMAKAVGSAFTMDGSTIHHSASKKSSNNNTSKHKIATGLATVIPGPAPLPQSPCEWGFLILSSDGHFHVNMEGKLGYYAESMRKKLANSSSVLVWVNVFNRFLRFFVRNFGNISPIFGLKHIDETMAGLKFVYEVAFKGLLKSDGNGEEEEDEFPNPIAVVEGMIKERFPALSKEKIPDAWFHWPITAGGLGIENPFINLMACKIQVERKTTSIYSSDIRGESGIPMEETYFYLLENADVRLFDHEKQAWNSKESARVKENANSKTPYVAVPFAEYGEWCDEYRERRTGSRWGARFRALVDASDLEPAEPELTPELNDMVYKFINRGKQLVGECSYSDDGNSEDGNERGLRPYWRWVLCFYGPALMEAFGSLEFMNTELIPMGMIGSLKSQGVPWD
ncbi:hypothetical protein BDR26DRAFT_937300 [Obelidium mucronatum]|nr:hypothetical protein BDR26DRAFT_937300 [Obelidium mucronatum]